MAPRKPKAEREVLMIRLPEVIDAIAELGVIRHACEAMGFERKALYRLMGSDPVVADAVRDAVERGREKRRDYLESIAYQMAPDNPVMVMFLLKREDPSYRESYNVHNTTVPTDYIIDLALPADGEAHDADPATTEVLE
jgi:hypothetical protein